MPIHRLRGDAEPIADLPDCQPVDRESQHLNLPIAQLVGPAHRRRRLLLGRRNYGSHRAGVQGFGLDLGLKPLQSRRRTVCRSIGTRLPEGGVRVRGCQNSSRLIQPRGAKAAVIPGAITLVM